MKLKNIVRNICTISIVLGLSACSAPGHQNKDQDMNGMSDANSSAETSGMNQGSNFGDENQGGPQQSVAKRTYYFDYDKSDIRDEYKSAIAANADYLMAHPKAKIILEGHTDPRGSREYNVALGERRANAVADFMKDKGVNVDQIRVVSYGAQRLAVPGHTEQAYQLDRRVILVYRN
ncbi:MAG: pal [Gammaproteobacteria bacterium]|nr:pal [Gammaproteobacteria bacterium]MCE3238665.1 pal [Gammaproteobacteria bacterium]